MEELMQTELENLFSELLGYETQNGRVEQKKRTIFVGQIVFLEK